MRVLKQSSAGTKVIAVVLTGDGRTEEKVLPAIAERYNGGDKALLFPKGPLSKKTGLNVLKSVLKVHELTGHTRYLLLVDKEHFDPEDLNKHYVKGSSGNIALPGQIPTLLVQTPLRCISLCRVIGLLLRNGLGSSSTLSSEEMRSNSSTPTLKV
ncbi:MAG: hypothetical protein GXO14_03465 [Thermococci archaeon]|nr:hypothetical protein [Thermococci archaeon]